MKRSLEMIKPKGNLLILSYSTHSSWQNWLFQIPSY